MDKKWEIVDKGAEGRPEPNGEGVPLFDAPTELKGRTFTMESVQFVKRQHAHETLPALPKHPPSK